MRTPTCLRRHPVLIAVAALAVALTVSRSGGRRPAPYHGFVPSGAYENGWDPYGGGAYVGGDLGGFAEPEPFTRGATLGDRGLGGPLGGRPADAWFGGSFYSNPHLGTAVSSDGESGYIAVGGGEFVSW